MQNVSDEYLAQIRQEPGLLLSDVEEKRISKKDAIIAIGKLLYGQGPTSVFKQVAFEDFWEKRIGNRQSFANAVADRDLSPVAQGIVAHTMIIADRLDSYAPFNGLSEHLSDHVIFKVARELGGAAPVKVASVSEDIEEDDPSDDVEEVRWRQQLTGDQGAGRDRDLGNRTRRVMGIDPPDLSRGLK